MFARLIGSLTASRERRIGLALAALTLMAGALIGVRTVVYHRGYIFLLWNLFLAWIPLLAAYGAARWARRRLAFVGLGLVWLAFFPNAPYVATDLMHLRTTRGAPLWLDVLAVGSAAATGVLIGLASTHVIHEAVRQTRARRWAWTVPVVAALAAGGGVYLGRVLRWNTWDIVTRPTELLESAWETLFEARFVAFALTFAFAFGVAYIAWRFVLSDGRRAWALQPTARSVSSTPSGSTSPASAPSSGSASPPSAPASDTRPPA